MISAEGLWPENWDGTRELGQFLRRFAHEHDGEAYGSIPQAPCRVGNTVEYSLGRSLLCRTPSWEGPYYWNAQTVEMLRAPDDSRAVVWAMPEPPRPTTEVVGNPFVSARYRYPEMQLDPAVLQGLSRGNGVLPPLKRPELPPPEEDPPAEPEEPQLDGPRWALLCGFSRYDWGYRDQVRVKGEFVEGGCLTSMWSPQAEEETEAIEGWRTWEVPGLTYGEQTTEQKPVKVLAAPGIVVLPLQKRALWTLLRRHPEVRPALGAVVAEAAQWAYDRGRPGAGLVPGAKVVWGRSEAQRYEPTVEGVKPSTWTTVQTESHPIGVWCPECSSHSSVCDHNGEVAVVSRYEREARTAVQRAERRLRIAQMDLARVEGWTYERVCEAADRAIERGTLQAWRMSRERMHLLYGPQRFRFTAAETHRMGTMDLVYPAGDWELPAAWVSVPWDRPRDVMLLTLDGAPHTHGHVLFGQAAGRPCYEEPDLERWWWEEPLSFVDYWHGFLNQWKPEEVGLMQAACLEVKDEESGVRGRSEEACEDGPEDDGVGDTGGVGGDDGPHEGGGV